MLFGLALQIRSGVALALSNIVDDCTRDNEADGLRVDDVSV